MQRKLVVNVLFEEFYIILVKTTSDNVGAYIFGLNAPGDSLMQNGNIYMRQILESLWFSDTKILIF